MAHGFPDYYSPKDDLAAILVELENLRMEPTAYTGEESVTFANGLITKRGKSALPSGSIDAATVTITFDTAFPNALKTCGAAVVVTTSGHTARIAIRNPTVTGFLVQINAGVATINCDGTYWWAEGW